MAFTYDLETDVGRFRFEIGDTAEDDGPRPGGKNFSDEEIQHFLDEEDTWQRSKAMAFETLAVEWADEPSKTKVGPKGETMPAHKYYRVQARYIRRAHGYTNATRRPAFNSHYQSVTVNPGA